MAPKARMYTPDDVADFLSSIQLEKYREVFINSEIGGDVLLDADEEFLTELGVESPLDCVHIIILFRQRLRETGPRIPISEVLRFLKENKFEKYVELFEKHKIDGEMLLDTQQVLMKNAFKEIGIGVVDRVKILSQFKTFANS